MFDDAIMKASGVTKQEGSSLMMPRENIVCQLDNNETLVEDKLRSMMMELLV